MKLAKLFAATALALGSSLAALPAMAQAITPLCSLQAEPTISFVEFPAPNLVLNASGQIVQNGTLTIKGKMRVPNCYGPVSKPGNKLPTVLIMHGSGGVDSRGDFHAQALNAAGFATLEIDMWEARGVTGVANRPALPALTFPDAYYALRFLSTQSNIDINRVGVLGFSWGGVMSLASATQNVVPFGGGLRFKAHVAHYPVCYAYNSPYIPNSGFGSVGNNPLTGAPILIQVGTQDDYDRANSSGDGSLACKALKNSLSAAEQAKMEVVAVDGAYHGWDRLMVPIHGNDPFAHLGADRYNSAAQMDIRPNVTKAYEARARLVQFFIKNL